MVRLNSSIFGLFILLMTAFPAECEQYTIYERSDISETDAIEALKLIQKVLDIDDKPPTVIKTIYFSEQIVGKFIMGHSPDMSDTFFRNINLPDTSIVYRCLAYVRTHKSRFRSIHDGWKGEFNLWEPQNHWLEVLRKKHPESTERWEVEWDYDYKNMTRQFIFSPEARGKSCEAYYDELIKKYPDEYEEAYSEKEITEVKRSCERERERYKILFQKLLEKFKGINIEKKMHDVEPTNVISDQYFGLC